MSRDAALTVFQLDRDFVETEFIADLIHQGALIRKVDAFGLGDKEDKGCD